MSKFGNTFKTYNVLNINNDNISLEHSKNCIEYIANIDKDVILLPVDSGVAKVESHNCFCLL